MPKGTPNTHRWNCDMDDYVVAALRKGFGVEMVLSDCPSFERVDEVRKGIYRCARHRRVTALAGPNRIVDEPGRMGMHKTGRTYQLRYKIIRKRDGRRYLLETYGPDRSNWPYDPRRPATDAERASWAPRTERGHTVTHE